MHETLDTPAHDPAEHVAVAVPLYPITTLLTTAVDPEVVAGKV